jgi:hypothetical protein
MIRFVADHDVRASGNAELDVYTGGMVPALLLARWSTRTRQDVRRSQINSRSATRARISDSAQSEWSIL